MTEMHLMATRIVEEMVFIQFQRDKAMQNNKKGVHMVRDV
jgi:hypothetical protein